MDQYLIYFTPYIVIGFSIMLGLFMGWNTPTWLEQYVVFCARMAGGLWVAGIVMVILISLSVHPGMAALCGLPVMYFSGSFFAKLADQAEESRRARLIAAGERRRQREKAEREAKQNR